jgi:heptosyltransferase-1
LGQHGLPSLVNYGPGEEAIARAVVAHSQGTATALFASLPELVAFTRRARLFIGGDTGPMHLAAALHVPVVALFGPTDPRRNGPFETEHIVLRSSMSATSYSHRRQTDAGLRAISSAEVIAAAESLLARTGGWR